MTRSASALGLLVALAAAGCFGGGPLDCESGGPTDLSGQTLQILDHGAFDYAFAALEPIFEGQTGASVERVEGADAGSALALAIQSRGNPPADVIYGVDNALFLQGARAGVFEPYASPNLVRLNLSRAQLDDFRFGGPLLATPADHGYVSVNYDVRLTQRYAAEALPKNLSDLADPEWASKFVVQDPRLSSPGLGFLIATVATFGENDDYDYLDYWQDLFDNGVLVADDWSEAYLVHYTAGYGQALEGFVGDRELVVSYTTSPAVEVYFSQFEDAPYTTPPSVSLEPPLGVFHQVETVAILKCTDQLPLAKAFVDFVLSPEFQNLTSSEMATYPVVQGADVIPQFKTLATDPSRLIPAPFSAQQLESGIPRWVNAWLDTYQESTG